MLSGDEALMNGLLGLFNNLYLAKPSAASSLSIDYNRYIQDYRGGARAYNFEKFI